MEIEMTTNAPELEWRGQKVVDSTGSKVGTLDEIYFDAETDLPEWAAVTTGMFGSRLSFVPLSRATSDGEHVHVGYEKSQIKDAPTVEADGDLAPDDEQLLYRHYGIDFPEAAAPVAPSPPDATNMARDDAMTRSEEELEVSTSQQVAGKVRLRKWVDTEQATQTVSLKHETATVTREPITDANRDKALDGPEITTAEHEITLMDETPVVEKRVVAKERVQVGKETVTEDETVAADLRKERIDIDNETRR
jgi:uncharacterized protein (TIGR02271 family)